MKTLNQQIIKFNHEQNFKYDDFYVSKSNKHVFDFLNQWPKWEKNFLNIIGEKFSGKTHLINIFMKKFSGIKLDANLLNNKNLADIKIHQNIILENIEKKVDERLIYTLVNIIDQDNKYLIITSTKPLVKIEFDLPDLRSRTKSFLFQSIENPDDELMFALILKNLSDRQISLEKKIS